MTTPAVAVAQSIRGTVVDSASGKGVARAHVSVAGTTLQATADSLGRFTIAAAPIGQQVLAIHTASLDSLNAGYSVPATVVGGTTTIAVRVPNALQIAATACGERGYGAGGILLGRLRVQGDSNASLSGTVSAEWGPRPSIADSTARRASGDARWVSATADARGRFALCGVPLDTALTLNALIEGASGQTTGLRVSAIARFARTEVVLRREVTTTGLFAGMVTDSANQPIAGAEVNLPELSKNTLTNAQGAFALRDIAPGSQHVVVRRVGYAAIDTRIAIEAGRLVERHIRLARATSLDSVVVTAKASDRALADFEANRKLGLGHFLTRAELAPQEGRSTGSVLTSMPGIKVYASGPYAWVGSGRHNATSINTAIQVKLDRADELKGAPLWDCYALVYLDDHLVFRGQTFREPRPPPQYRWEPLFDINSISVSEIESIEYYATASQTPTKYASLNSECGVLVIHTLRFHPAGDTTTAPRKPPAR